MRSEPAKRPCHDRRRPLRDRAPPGADRASGEHDDRLEDAAAGVDLANVRRVDEGRAILMIHSPPAFSVMAARSGDCGHVEFDGVAPSTVEIDVTAV
ncbi:MAG: hypothetical protein ACXVDD_14230 [Polyangia bacterium]